MKEYRICHLIWAEFQCIRSALLTLNRNQQILSCHVGNKNVKSFKSQTNPENREDVPGIIHSFGFLEQICRRIKERMSVPELARTTLKNNKSEIPIKNGVKESCLAVCFVIIYNFPTSHEMMQTYG